MGVGMAVLSAPCMSVLYPGSAGQGGVLLMELGIVCYFMTMSLMTNSILPANGNENLPLVSSILGLITKIVTTYLFVGNPRLNIYGAPLGTLSCYIVMLTTNLIFIARNMARPVHLGRVFGRAGLSAAIMGVSAWGTWTLLHRAMLGNHAVVMGREISVLLPFTAAVAVGVIVYAVMIVALRAITLEDMKLIPKGEKVAKLLHIR